MAFKKHITKKIRPLLSERFFVRRRLKDSIILWVYGGFQNARMAKKIR